MRTKTWIALVVCALALPLAFGCDDGDDPIDSGMAEDTGTGGDDGGTMGNTIADIATSDENFSMLVAAADQAGLVAVLEAPGPYTVFAPTNAAFEASGITMAMIEGMSNEQLTAILTYHVISGAAVDSSSITAGPAASAAGGVSLILGTEGGVTINGGNAVTGGANVVTADIEASNGIIHVIDRVLLPPDIPMLATYAGLTTLVSAVADADLVETLQGEGPFTVFAPTNEAFEALSEVPTGDALAQVLLYHVISGAAVPSGEVPDFANSAATNAYGNGLTLIFDTSDGVTINGFVNVSVANVVATNGIVHVVDAVLIPLNVPDAAGAAGLSELVTAVGAAAPLSDGTTVAEALSANEPYTVFAPTNEAFGRAPGDLSADALRDVLLTHVVNAGAPVLSDGIPPTADSLNGTLTFDTAATPPTVSGPSGATGAGAADILITDINVTNGVVHVISEVLLP